MFNLTGKKMIAILTLIFCSQIVLAQPVAVLPGGNDSQGSMTTGNDQASDCAGNKPSQIVAELKPSCFGANLRGYGSGLQASGDIHAKFDFKRGSQTFTKTVIFPVKAFWKENTGVVCTVDRNTMHVTCPVVKEDTNETFSMIYRNCQKKNNGIAPGVKGEYYDNCAQQPHPTAGTFGQASIQCRNIFYGYKEGNGNDFNPTQMSCLFYNPNEDFGNEVRVVDAAGAPMNFDAFATPGTVKVKVSGVDIPKPTWSINAQGQTIQSGASTSIDMNLTQNGRPLLKNYASFTGDHYHECFTAMISVNGARGYCGGYKSPLMAFFDKRRPMFLGSSNFPLKGGMPQLVAWPEQNAPGWFLALDKYGNKKILSGDQLFTESSDHSNGFEALRKLDSNKDGVIDKKDKLFHRLLLWKDKNSDGLSTVSKGKDNEVIKLTDKKVFSISLKYNNDRRLFKNYHNRAQGRQTAVFKFKVKEGKGKKAKWKVKDGQMVDIWFRELQKSVAQK